MSHRGSVRGVSGLILQGAEILLVELQGPEDPLPAWGLPGGQLAGVEDWLDGLRREVSEETGLSVVGAPVEAFRIVGENGSEWRTYACPASSGEVQPVDPDGDVLRAAWFPLGIALAHLEALSWYDASPFRAWLTSSGRNRW